MKLFMIEDYIQNLEHTTLRLPSWKDGKRRLQRRFMIRKRQPERIGRMSWWIYETEYTVCLWTQMMRKKNIQKVRKERWEGENENTSVCFVWLVEAVTGERRRTDKQTMLWVRKYNWWFVLEGMLPLWTAPALYLLSPSIWPLCPGLHPGRLPWQWGCLAGLAQVRHLDQGHSPPPTPLAPTGIIFSPSFDLQTGSTGINREWHIVGWAES